mmetsp:Transcript_88701/g.153929  ORF Transcript_88701/g.153929 Transcript_88701/m.153929 type:complete len:128 (-) Transcript_88701:114-497(-)
MLVLTAGTRMGEPTAPNEIETAHSGHTWHMRLFGSNGCGQQKKEQLSTTRANRGGTQAGAVWHRGWTGEREKTTHRISLVTAHASSTQTASPRGDTAERTADRHTKEWGATNPTRSSRLKGHGGVGM